MSKRSSSRAKAWDTELLFIEFEGKLVCGLCDYEPKVHKTDRLETHFKTHLKSGVTFEELFERRQNKIKQLLIITCDTSSQMSVDLSQPSTSSTNQQIDHLLEPRKRLQTSFQIAELIAKSGHELSVGELIKDCLKLAAVNSLPEEYHTVFDEIALSSFTIRNRIKDISGNIEEQLNEKTFVDYSLSFDESTDITDTPFLATFIRGVDQNFEVTEELLSLKSFETTTTGKDIFDRLPLNSENRDLSRLNSLTTDGHPNNLGCHVGAVKRVQNHVRSEGFNTPVLSFQCVIHQEELCAKNAHFPGIMETVVKTVNKIRKHALVHRQFKTFIAELDNQYRDVVYFSQIRWLSKGKCLKVFFDNYKQMDKFFKTVIKKPVKQLSDHQWYFELAFLTDMTQILNLLKLKMMGRNRLISEQFKEVKSCEQLISAISARFSVIESLSDNIPFDYSHLECVNKVIIEMKQNFTIDKIVTFLSDLLKQFETRFSDFQEQEIYFKVFENPFDVNPVPIDFQFEINLLKGDSYSRDLFQKAPNILEFYAKLSNYPTLKRNASKCVSHFGSTYRCEHIFGLMKQRKTSTTNRLADDTLSACLRISVSELRPNFQKLVDKIKQISD